MQLVRIATVVVAAFAGAAAAAQADTTGTGATQSYTRTSAVYSGSVVNALGTKVTLGNRHVVKIETIDSKTTGTMTSYTCATGTTVTTIKAPPMCTLRGSFTLKAAPRYEGGPLQQIGRVSAGGGSARQQGDLGLYKAGVLKGSVPVDLSMAGYGEADGDDAMYYQNAKLTGTFAGLSKTSGVAYRAILGWPRG